MASLINNLGTSISQISIWYKAVHITGFPSGLAVKIPPAMQEMQEMRVQSLGQRKKWQLTPAFLPGESHGQKNLVSCNPWGHKELDTTEVIKHARIAHYFLPMAIIKIAYDHSCIKFLTLTPKNQVRVV